LDWERSHVPNMCSSRLLLKRQYKQPNLRVSGSLVASLVEHFEKIGKYVIDDNITVPLSNLIILLVAKLLS